MRFDFTWFSLYLGSGSLQLEFVSSSSILLSIWNRDTFLNVFLDSLDSNQNLFWALKDMKGEVKQGTVGGFEISQLNWVLEFYSSWMDYEEFKRILHDL
jgi:hypothetical protein